MLFRVIRLGVSDTGSRELAQTKAKGILESARQGNEFGELARTRNDDRA